MRLLAPWALLGLVAIAVPVIAHLLARRPPRRVRFPNLRFVPQTPPTPVKRHRITDAGLLVLRAVIVATAVMALSRPEFGGPTGPPSPAGLTGPAGSQDSSGASDSPGASGPSTSRELTTLVSATERSGAEAAVAAAVKQGAPARVAGDRNIAVVFPGFENREALRKDHVALSQPWMADTFASVAADPLVTAAAARLNRTPLDLLRVTGDRAEPGRMLLFLDAPPHSLIAAATTAAILRSASPASAPLRSAASGPRFDTSFPTERSDGRWFWLAAGLLLAAETLARRRRPPSPQIEEHARVA